MTVTRKQERYRDYDLVADIELGQGRAWKKDGSRFECEGGEVETLLQNLRQQIDAAFPRVAIDLANTSVDNPALAAAYAAAFHRVMNQEGVPDSYRAMARGLLAAPGYQMNDYELQAAAGFKHVNAVNLHFGVFGGRILSALMDLGFQIALPPNPDGSPCLSYTIARNINEAGKDGLCTWRLRPESVLALQAAGIS